MPRYIVKEERSYTERWIIEADSEQMAKQLYGVILDHDDGAGSDEGQSVDVEQTEDDRDEL